MSNACKDRYLIDWKINELRNCYFYAPKNLKIAPEYLGELSNDEFLEAANFLVKFIHYMMDRIQQDPEYYGMTCISVEGAEDKKNWSKTNTNFYRLLHMIGNIFNSIGENGTQLDCQVSRLNPRPSRKFPHILEIFKAFGFEISGLDEKMKPADGENFTIYYPSNPDIFSAFQKAGFSFNLGVFCHWGKLAAEEEERRRFPFNFYMNHLTDESLKKLFTEMNLLLSKEGLTYPLGEDIQILRNALRYKYKREKEFLIFRVHVSQHVDCKLRLSHIEQYETVLQNCTETIRQKIFSNHLCNHCCDCTTQISLQNDGKQYVFCNPTGWWMPFSLNDLHDLTDADIESILSLIRAELPYYLNHAPVTQ